MEIANKQFAGKVALVTGSSRGLGRAIASRLAGLGAKVAVHGTTPYSARAFNEAESLAAVADAIAAETGAEVLGVYADLADEAEVARLVSEVRARFGRIDLLVNCAGGDVGAQGTSAPRAGKPQPNDAVFIPMADVRAVLDRNLMSCILTCKAVAPEMMDRKAGRIVNIGSVAGSVGREDGAIYCVAKAAVAHYTRCLAAQLRPYNVTVNAVAPGAIITARFVASRPIADERMVHDGTLERYGWPEEIANAVAFFLADGSAYISGQILRVDGAGQLSPA
ncbi:MAG: SDR family NAD(P)-dependent oxidoreductase [Chloroflexota bacterium]